MKTKMISLLCLITLFLTFILSSQVFASPFNYKLVGGVTDRYFNIPPNANNYTLNGWTVNYDDRINAAVNTWNSMANDEGFPARRVDVSFSETSVYSNAQIRFAVYEFQECPILFGLATFYNSSGNPIYNKSGPTQDYVATRAHINVLSVHYSSNTLIDRVIKHEMGHSLGLGHDYSAFSSLMKENILASAANNPTSRDLDNLNSISGY